MINYNPCCCLGCTGIYGNLANRLEIAEFKRVKEVEEIVGGLSMNHSGIFLYSTKQNSLVLSYRGITQFRHFFTYFRITQKILWNAQFVIIFSSLQFLP